MAITGLDDGAEEVREKAYAFLDALDETPRHARMALAVQAIRTDPTLTDAYLAAADTAPRGSLESATLWLAASELARRDAGQRIEMDAGSLWSSLHGRPYMRACAGYADCCFDRHDFGDAIAQCKRLLALDPADPLEAAPLLGASLLRSGDRAGFEAFRDHHGEDPRPAWLYVDAFYAASAKIPAKLRNALLDRAITSNQHVPIALVSAPIDLDRIAHYTPGSGDEALVIGASRPALLWRNHPTALRALLRRADATTTFG
ncbi:MAG: hypothetical protein EON87_01155 [Brevundimonas sp.]|nr:MAG: hypothetical protein EON87_01155 [Brevundimonas sp.]